MVDSRRQILVAHPRIFPFISLEGIQCSLSNSLKRLIYVFTNSLLQYILQIKTNLPQKILKIWDVSRSTFPPKNIHALIPLDAGKSKFSWATI